MKLRVGFVSNSSSSSFVAIGRSIDIEDVTEEIMDNVVVVGDDVSDGSDVFFIQDRNILRHLKVFKNYKPRWGDDDTICDFEIYEIFKYEFEKPINFKKAELPDNADLMVIEEEVGYGATDTYEKFIERYSKFDVPEVAMDYINKFFRKDKLIRVLNE